MTEFMGLINGSYDAKSGGFLPGGSSLHSICSPHGPDVVSYSKAIAEKDTGPVRQAGGMAFMFESCLMLSPSKLAMNCDTLQLDYHSIWQGFQQQISINEH